MALKIRVWDRCIVTSLGALALLTSACSGAADASASANGAGDAGGASASADGRGAARTDRHTVMDPGGPLGRMPALDVMVPPGWRAESTVRWDNVNGQCSFGMGSPMFRMTSADGRSSMEQFPGFVVTTSAQDIVRRGSQPGDFCIVALTDSGEAFARRVAIPFLRPQARIQAMRQVPLDPQVIRFAQSVAQVGNGMRVVPYGIETTIANPDGSIEKITLGGVILVQPQLMPGVPPIVLNQNFVGYAVRAPADRIAEVERLWPQIRASIRPNPAWKQGIEAYQQRITRPVFARPGSRGNGGRGNVGSGNGAGSDWMDDVANRNREDGRRGDREQEGRIDVIREEQRCQLPNGTFMVQSIHVPCPS